ncbi:MAG: hypothetical protein AAGE43_01455 [Pseudomonadota bacterium]
MPTSFQADVDAVFATLAKAGASTPGVAAQVDLTELQARGWLVPGWTQPWGTTPPLTPAEALYLDRARLRAGLVDPDPLVADLLGPLLIELASREQLERWLPETALGRLRWRLHSSLLGGEALPFALGEGNRVMLAAPVTLWPEDAASTLPPAAPDLLAILGRRETSGREAGGDGALLVVSRSALTDADSAAQDLSESSVEVAGQIQDLALLKERIETLRGEADLAPRSLAAAIERLLEDAAPDLEADVLADQEIALRTLRALEERAYGAAVDADLAGIVRLRGAELGASVARQYLEGLGYYALADAPRRQHNELPDAAFRAHDAVTRLIRYVGGLESVRTRDAIARRRFNLDPLLAPSEPRDSD